MPEATNISHDSISPRALSVAAGMNWPVFSPRYSRIALLSNTTASPSIIDGSLAFGLIMRYAALCCSPLRLSMGTGSYASPISSRHSATFIGFGAVL